MNWTNINFLNGAIKSDANLGNGFEVGHSYFMDGSDAKTKWKKPADEVFASVVKFEIAPLLEEYWFDNADLAQEHIDKLNG